MAPEFKQEVVRVALTSGLSHKQVASDFGIAFFHIRPLDKIRASSSFNAQSEMGDRYQLYLDARRLALLSAVLNLVILALDMAA